VTVEKDDLKLSLTGLTSEHSLIAQ